MRVKIPCTWSSPVPYMHYISRQAAMLVLLWLQRQAVKAPHPLCMDSAGTGCSWAAERSWHAPLSHGLRRLRLRRRQGWWWMGCRPCLPSSFDRAAVICYRATIASINFWHMHTCTLTTTDLPLLHIQSHSFWLRGEGTRQSEAKYLNVFTVGALFRLLLVTSAEPDRFFSQTKLFHCFCQSCLKCTFTAKWCLLVYLRNLNNRRYTA